MLLITLGCEGTNVQQVADGIAETGKRVEIIGIQETGGMVKTIEKALVIAREMADEADKCEREECGPEDIVLGLKCGSSDTTSGLGPNPALGVAVEKISSLNGTAILGEITEIIGAEHLMVDQAKDEEVGRRIIELADRMETGSRRSGSICAAASRHRAISRVV